VIVDPDQPVPSRLAIVAYRSFLLDDPEIMLFEQLSQFTEFHLI